MTWRERTEFLLLYAVVAVLGMLAYALWLGAADAAPVPKPAPLTEARVVRT